MSELSPRLLLPLLQPAQAQKHVTHNEALDLLDLLVQLVVEAVEATTPPSEPQEDQIWALGAAPVLDWAGQAGRIARWRDGAWHFVIPQDGWRAWDKGAGVMRVWQSGAWVDLASLSPLQNLPGVGIGTTSDATNRLAVASAASLFSHAGTDHRLSINKAAPADTASMVFQSGWSGRAEMGLAGSDDFALRVSADGSSFTTALQVSRTTGLASGAAVTQGAADATAGRLMRVGDFGLGTPVGSAQPQVTLNSAVVPGQYGYLGSDPNAPSPGNSGQVVVERQATANLRQEAGDATGGGRWQRRSTNGGTTWTAWRRIVNAETLLGQVTQSGGVPTGAVLERGSNANGEFLRLADGTQFCWSAALTVSAINTALGPIFESEAISWVYPAAFSAIPPFVSAGGGDTRRWGTCSPGAGQSASIRLLSPTVNNNAQTVRALAIGRWF